MTDTKKIVTAGLLLLAWASVARADDTRADDGLEGARVRLRTASTSEARTGVVESWTPAELVIRPEPDAVPLRVPRGEITSLEVSRGTRRHPLAGLLGGALAWGAIVGLTAAFSTLDESGLGAPAFIGGMLVVGTGVGALVQTERWEPVPASRLSVAVVPAPRGAQVRFSLRF
jgi:hypothetical protein